MTGGCWPLWAQRRGPVGLFPDLWGRVATCLMLISLRRQDDTASANVGKQKPGVNCCFWTNYCCLGGCCSAITDRNRESLLHLCATLQLPILSEADRNRCYSKIIAVTPASRRLQKAGSDNGLISSKATSRYKKLENECDKIQIPFCHTSDCPVTEHVTTPGTTSTLLGVLGQLGQACSAHHVCVLLSLFFSAGMNLWGRASATFC